MAAPQYDAVQSILYTLPDTGATINVNSLPEQVVDQLIAKYGAQGPLLGRKEYLAQQRGVQEQAAQEQANSAAAREKQIQDEVMQRTSGDLQNKLDSIFGQVEAAGTQKIDEQAAGNRRRAIAEEAALGRLTSPAAFAPGSRIGQVDTARNNAMTQLFGNIATQKAAGQLDFTKTLQDILQQDKALKQQASQFGQNLQFNRDSLLNSINQQNENRGLDRYLADFNARNTRDMNTPDEWTKQLGRISGVTNNLLNIGNSATQAYNAQTNRQSANSAADANMLKLLFA